jgi:hypothetical protein
LGNYNGQKIGVRVKGIVPSKKITKSNSKYWSKSIVGCILDISDATNCDIAGIAIFKNYDDTLRGILSSHHNKISDQIARGKRTRRALR